MKVYWWGVKVWLSSTTVGNILGGTITAAAITLGILFPGIGWAIGIGIGSFILSAYASYYAPAIVVGYYWNGKQRFAYKQ